MAKQSLEKAVERILRRLWDKAAASGDSKKLIRLRGAFEANALRSKDRPVLVRKLTQNQVAIAEDAFPEADDVMSSGRSWLLLRDQGAAQSLVDECPTLLDDALERAYGNNIDMTDAQQEFTTRSVTKSVNGLCRRLSKVARR
jgi:hypothetical protein